MRSKEKKRGEADVHNESDQCGDGGMTKKKERDGDGMMLSAKPTQSMREKC